MNVSTAGSPAFFLGLILLPAVAGAQAGAAKEPVAEATAERGPKRPPTPAFEALQEGNRLFRNGQISEAVDTYLAGYSPEDPHPTLLYNLGTALHHLDRLPEAVLWYRRATGSEDPWLEENLWLARRSLGSQILPAGGALGWLGRHTAVLRFLAAALAWAAFLFYLADLRAFPLWGLTALTLSAALIYASAIAVDRFGPRPAVILMDCHTLAGELPAGTEAWVRGGPGGWSASGVGTLECPPEALDLIFP